MAVWALPFFYSPKLNQSLPGQIRKYTAPIFRWTGLWQGWSMFAPNPSNQNINVQIAIEFFDGSFEFITMPTLHDMTPWDAYRAERHRKFADNARRDDNRAMWPGMAKYYQNLFEPKRKVKRMDFVRWWTLVKDPDTTQPPPPQPSYMNYDNSFIFYTVKYDQ